MVALSRDGTVWAAADSKVTVTEAKADVPIGDTSIGKVADD